MRWKWTSILPAPASASLVRLAAVSVMLIATRVFPSLRASRAHFS